MADPWVAIDATVRRSDKLAALPSDTARWGWLVMLGEAKLLRRQGTFSNGQWVELMGRYGKYLADYIRTGLLHRSPAYCDEDRQRLCLRGRGPFTEGTLVVHDWPHHQREHALRQQDYRDRDAEGDGPSDAVGDSLSDGRSDTPSRALSPSSVDSPSQNVDGSTSRARGSGDPEPEFPLLQWLGQHGCYITPGNGYHRQLVTAVEHTGVDPFLEALSRLSRAGVQDGDTKGFVFGAIDMLRQKPDLRALEAEDDAEEARKRQAIKDQRAAANLAYLRGDYPSFAEAMTALTEGEPA